MTFLSWQSSLLLAAVVLPLLVLLYFLKLRRQRREVASTFLWKRAVEDLRVNAPFQKLRRNLLLFLQMLLLMAVLAGIAEPMARFLRAPRKRVVLMLDRSGSMRARETDGRTRLEHARDAAVEFVQGLPSGTNVLVLAFSATPAVLQPFTSDKRRLIRSILDVEGTDEPTLVDQALPLAIAEAATGDSSGGSDSGPAVEEQPRSNDESASGGDSPVSAIPDASLPGEGVDLEFFTDGRIADARKAEIQGARMRFHRVGAATDNVGITTLDVRRDIDRPGVVFVFVEIENFGEKPVTTDVSLSLDGKRLSGPGSIREIFLGPAAPEDSFLTRETEKPAETSPRQSVVFEFPNEAGGLVRVELHRPDALAGDNAVTAIVDPPRSPRILLVTDRPRVRAVLMKALEALEITDGRAMTTAEYEAADASELVEDGRLAFDAAIMDRHDTDRLPPGSYVFLGGIPRMEGVSWGGSVEHQPIVFGREDHPIMRHVDYETLVVTRWREIALPDHAVPLLEGPDSALLFFLAGPGHRYLIAAFDLLESNLPLEEAFPMLVQNTIAFLGPSGQFDPRRAVRPGDAVSINAPAEAKVARVHQPSGRRETEQVRPGAELALGGTHDVGVYRVEFDDPRKTTELVAVNLLDANESRIAPRESLTIGEERMDTRAAETKMNVPLWRYAVAAALLVLLLEWWVYNRRVMI